MSRVGRRPVIIPKGVAVTIAPDNMVTVKGPKGTLSRQLSQEMNLVQEGGQILVQRPTDQRHHRALHGLTRVLLNNMVLGVSEGFQKELEIIGVGYRADGKGSKLTLQLGYSHPIEFNVDGLTFETDRSGHQLLIKGIDKEVVGQVAADVRRCRPPEPYKGKGVRYKGEYVRQKVGKAGKR